MLDVNVWQREGIARAKAEGVYRGGKRRLDRELVAELTASGMGPAAVAKAVGCSRMQVYRILRDEAPARSATALSVAPAVA